MNYASLNNLLVISHGIHRLDSLTVIINTLIMWLYSYRSLPVQAMSCRRPGSEESFQMYFVDGISPPGHGRRRRVGLAAG